ncbi:MAG TPA: cyclic nucleotide-binding domain-containing protein [Chroococcales cyanobacterium]|jgi:CRP-like cAMP-binding protein
MQKLGGRLGQYLITKGLVSEAQLEKALELQKSRGGKPFAEILVDLGYVSTNQLNRIFPEMSLVEVIKDKELASFANSFTHHSCSQGQVIFNQGDVGLQAFVIIRGKVDILVVDPEGKKVPIATLLPGELFGEIALLDGDTRSATAMAAAENTELMVLQRDDFLLEIRRKPDLAIEIFKLFARRLRKTSSQIAER